MYLNNLYLKYLEVDFYKVEQGSGHFCTSIYGNLIRLVIDLIKINRNRYG